MKTIKELEAEILSTAWADEIFTKKGAVDALKDVLGLIDEMLNDEMCGYWHMLELKKRIIGE